MHRSVTLVLACIVCVARVLAWKRRLLAHVSRPKSSPSQVSHSQTLSPSHPTNRHTEWCRFNFLNNSVTYTRTIILRLFWILSGTTQVSRYQKGKTNLDLLEQETVSGISWAICKSAPRCRQITMPASHHSVFYRPDALPAAQTTASKHWRH